MECAVYYAHNSCGEEEGVDGCVLQKTTDILVLLTKEDLVCSPGVGSSTHTETFVTLVLGDGDRRVPGAHWPASLCNCLVFKRLRA